jgi:hypothetical protein
MVGVKSGQRDLVLPGKAEDSCNDPGHDSGLSVYGRPDLRLAPGASHLHRVRAKLCRGDVLHQHLLRLLLLERKGHLAGGHGIRMLRSWKNVNIVLRKKLPFVHFSTPT